MKLIILNQLKKLFFTIWVTKLRWHRIWEDDHIFPTLQRHVYKYICLIVYWQLRNFFIFYLSMFIIQQLSPSLFPFLKNMSIRIITEIVISVPGTFSFFLLSKLSMFIRHQLHTPLTISPFFNSILPLRLSLNFSY